MNNKFFSIFLIFSIILSFFISDVYGWDDCPFGMTNSSCYYPGKCGRYIDTNNNGICDHSEPYPTTENSGVENSQTTTTVNIDTSNESLYDKYVPTPSSELKNYTIGEVCKLYNISVGCLIESLKNIIKNKTYDNEIKENDSSSIKITPELVEEYVDISGSELKKYTIKEICEKYNINPELLKEKLGISVSDDTTFDTIKKSYGISPSKVKEVILLCLIEEGEVHIEESEYNESYEQMIKEREELLNNLNENTKLEDVKEVFGLSPMDIKEAIYTCMVKSGKVKNDNATTVITSKNDNNKEPKSIFDIIVSFFFKEINILDLIKSLIP